MSKASSSSWAATLVSSTLLTVRRCPAVSRKRTILSVFGGALSGAPVSSPALFGAAATSGAGEDTGTPLRTFSFFSFFSFAFLRTFTRSTMGLLQLMLACGGVDAFDVDNLGVLAECVEQSGRGQGVDQPRNAAAQHVNLFHRFPAERIARATGHADAVLHVLDC